MFSFTVSPFSILTEDKELNPTFNITWPVDNFVYYTGHADNVVEPVITLNGIKLKINEDYELHSESVEAGKATLTLKGINSLVGEYDFVDAFDIIQAFNGWKVVPSIMFWTYYGYRSDVNLINAVATFGDAWFAVTDENGNAIEGLEKITLVDGLVTEDVAIALNKLNYGLYRLYAHVDETKNYAGLAPAPVEFRVFMATNSWKTTPSVKTWIEGEYKKNGKINVEATFGVAHVIIKGSGGKVYYDNVKGIDKLAEAPIGRYTLTASVEADELGNYSRLDTYTVIFQVFEKPGMPWWGTLIIAIGVLLIAALIIFILWKKGVFEILTQKVVVAIRTRASVEATIASIRAAKRAEEGKKSVAAAKRRERLERMRLKAQEERALSPEERAAKLEEKARASEARAEKLRVQSEKTRERAAKLRESAPQTEQAIKADAPAEEAAATTPEAPTEE